MPHSDEPPQESLPRVAHLAGVFVILCLTSHAPVVRGEGLADDCERKMAEASVTANGEVILNLAPGVPQQDLVASLGVIDEVAKECPIGDQHVCSSEKLLNQLSQTIREKAGAAMAVAWQSGPGVSLRRTIVVGVWLGTVIVPSLATAKLTSDFDPMVSAMLVALVSRVTGNFFYYLGMPIESRYGPPMGSFAMWFWGPSRDDLWGKTVEALDDKARTVADYAGTQIVVLDPHLKAGGLALQEKNFEAAAEEYVAAILQSFFTYRGTNLDHEGTVDRVSHNANRYRNLSADELEAFRNLVAAKFLQLPLNRIPQKHNRRSLAAAVMPIIEAWFQHDR